jgi:D-alanyl-D-alanine carboxypeptidase
MQVHAARDDIALHMVSAFRSVEYQVSLFKEKLSKGQHINDILRVNAAPGYSQHHSGRAIDITTDNSDPLCESFERTPAFRWLSEHAGAYHFFLSYPRNNKWGISYEPWHWFYRIEERAVGDGPSKAILKDKRKK